ncbi:cysteine hydrolase family protein [Massilia sp. SYSU DXS3249]
MSTSACLIIIDMQKGMASPKAGQRNNPSAERNIAELLDTWRRCGRPVVHVRHISRSSTSPFAPGQPGAEFQNALRPLPQEHVVEKNVTDTFIHSGLERWLRVRGIEELVFTGVATNYSVEASARSAGNLGFTTTVVSDATFAFAMTDYAGTARSADEVHAMALANLDGEYAGILDTQGVLARYR